jgi:lysozyme
MNDALKLIDHFERASCEDPLTAHRNAYGVLAVGYGHTQTAMDGQTITREQADNLLIWDVQWITEEIDKLLAPTAKREINANMRQAVASFAHSIGIPIFRQTTVLTRMNARRYADVPKEMAKLNHFEGRELLVLKRRREAEGMLFCSFPNWLK